MVGIHNDNCLCFVGRDQPEVIHVLHSQSTDHKLVYLLPHATPRKVLKPRQVALRVVGSLTQYALLHAKVESAIIQWVTQCRKV